VEVDETVVVMELAPLAPLAPLLLAAALLEAEL